MDQLLSVKHVNLTILERRHAKHCVHGVQNSPGQFKSCNYHDRSRYADATYIEPLNEYALTEIIKKKGRMRFFQTLEDKRV